MKKKIEELNLIDNFLFGSVVTYPEVGEEFVRLLLETIFQLDFGRIKIIPQKVYNGADTDLHGVRLDVYVETESERGISADASVFDIEPEKNDREELVQALPQRTRFYHAKIDATSLQSGDGYEHLKKVIVVMIMPFDPFGKDRVVYTIRNMCQEEPQLPYDDGARTLFLYTKGTRGRTRKKLRELLHYMEDSTAANAVNPSLRKLHRMVETVKLDKEVSLDYMKIFEHEEMIRKEGREEGREEGRREQMAYTERERLRAEAAEQKVRTSTFTAIKNIMKNLDFTAEQAMQALSVSEAEKRLYRSQL
ncbi:MAG: Rpn family recombination-promoting nuclease/putative transposase [Clostridiales bacterium]|nr:Rpn family recombination-promoting nuclease/putative transposase [Clostridiales bacterium]